MHLTHPRGFVGRMAGDPVSGTPATFPTSPSTPAASDDEPPHMSEFHETEPELDPHHPRYRDREHPYDDGNAAGLAAVVMRIFGLIR